MASSNRHWPSMFKSKPHHHQWQHDIDSNSHISSAACHRTVPFSSSGCEERSPEPKPRWNPKPEQIRILESIFNSGMVNPPRDEIRKIRAQLQEYGQVGDANVFYWFQNRKSRSKHKLRHLQNSSNTEQQQITNRTPPPPMINTSSAPSGSSSSSSSEKSSPKERTLPLRSPSVNHHHVVSSNSPTGSVNQTNYFQTHSDQFASEVPYLFPVHQQGGFLFSELSNVVHHDQTVLGPCTSLLLGEIMSSSSSNTLGGAKKKDHEEYRTMKIHPHQLSHSVTSVDPSINLVAYPPTPSVTTTVGFTVSSSTIDQIQGVAESGGVALRPTVFINDVAFEVNVGPFNVREAFGDDAMLIHSSGQPVLTNEWGFTLQSLQHGASYYLVTFS